jgi:hypothetical protein
MDCFIQVKKMFCSDDITSLPKFTKIYFIDENTRRDRRKNRPKRGQGALRNSNVLL